MTKDDVAMQVLRILDGGDSNGEKFNILDISLAVQQTAAKMIQDEFRQNYQQFGESIINTNYIEYFEENPVLYNEVTGIYYCKMPTDLLTLPNDISVQFVGRSMNINDPFTRTTLGTTSFFYTLPDDVISYYVTADKISFVRFDPLIKNVVMGLIPALPNEINADDVPEIMQIVVKQFSTGMQTPMDKSVDSNPNNR